MKKPASTDRGHDGRSGNSNNLQTTTGLRAFVRRLLGPRLIARVRRCFRREFPAAGFYREMFQHKHGLEIGGPSFILSDDGEFPVYRVLDGLDNCLFSSQTIWTGECQAGKSFVFHPKKSPGTQLFCDASDLGTIQDSSYEAVLASHCLEHIANPLRALAEWKRVLKPEGLLLLILPHKDGTFDWHRPTTPLGHMIADFRGQVGEDDLTHLPEILELHDLDRDRAAGTKAQFHSRCLQNFSNRAMHHHVFDTNLATALLDEAGFQVIRVDSFKPYHIVILATSRNGRPDNTVFLGQDASYRKNSPFASDRVIGAILDASPKSLGS